MPSQFMINAFRKACEEAAQAVQLDGQASRVLAALVEKFRDRYGNVEPENLTVPRALRLHESARVILTAARSDATGTQSQEKLEQLHNRARELYAAMATLREPVPAIEQLRVKSSP